MFKFVKVLFGLLVVSFLISKPAFSSIAVVCEKDEKKECIYIDQPWVYSISINGGRIVIQLDEKGLNTIELICDKYHYTYACDEKKQD